LNLRPIHIILGIGLFAAGCGSNPDGAALMTVQNARRAVSQEQKDATGAPPALVFIEFVRTPQDVTDRMLKMARVTKNDVVCDLGCGDGRILVTAAKRYGCRAIGYDLDPLRVEEARENAERQGVSHLVTVVRKDVQFVDLEGVSVVTVYMGTEINARLIPQLRRLKPGARIVSHDFAIGDIPPDKTVTMTSRQDNRRHRILLWRCPLQNGPE
jgi:SAM-dependent methyltransferase